MSPASSEPPAASAVIRALAAQSVLHLGGDQLPPWGAPGAVVVVVDTVNATAAHLDRRFELVVLGASALLGDAGGRRAVLHTALQHCERDGHLVVLHGDTDHPSVEEMRALDLVPIGQHPAGELCCTLFRRGVRNTVHDMTFEARRTVPRLSPDQLHALLRSPAPPLLIDTRTPTDRARFGTIEGAIHLPRTVLEWRLDPANGYLHPAVTSFAQALVIICNHGYSSSVAAASVQRLGYSHLSDLRGGMQAWIAAGLPVVPPDHTFLELY